MENLNQSKIVIIGISLNQTYKFLKTIIPYYMDINEPLFEEVKQGLKTKQLSNQIKNKLNIETKYYEAGINVFCYTYNDILEDDEPEEAIQNIKKTQGNFDAIYFLTKIKNKSKIEGLDEYQEIADKFIGTFTPQLQTLIFDVKDESLINDERIQSVMEKVQQFVEPVYEDFQGLSNQDIVVKQKSKSLYEDTDGVSRIIEAMESTMWTGYIPASKNKKTMAQRLQEATESQNNAQIQAEKEFQLKSEQIQDGYLQEEEEKQQQNNDNTEDQIQEHNFYEQKIDPRQQEQTQSEQLNQITVQEDSQKEQQNKNKQENEKEEKQQQQLEIQKQVQQQQEENKEVKKQIPKKQIPETEEETEQDIGNFVNILGQMNHVRQNASNLPDDERKKQAEKIMQQLIMECGQLDGDEDLDDFINGDRKKRQDEEKSSGIDKDKIKNDENKDSTKNPQKEQKQSNKGENLMKGMKKGFLN